MLQFLAEFVQAHPELDGNDFYVTGESYAGIYVPLFVDAWLADPVVGPGGRPINFGGFAVGDGFPGCVEVEGKPVDWCVDLENVAFFKYPNALPGPFWDVEFFHGHSQMSESLYRRIQTNCSAAELQSACAELDEHHPCLCQELMGGGLQVARVQGWLRGPSERWNFHADAPAAGCPVTADGAASDERVGFCCRDTYI